MLEGKTRIPPVDVETLPDDLRETLEEQRKLRGAPPDTSMVIEASTGARGELLRRATSVSGSRLLQARRCRRSSGSPAVPAG